MTIGSRVPSSIALLSTSEMFLLLYNEIKFLTIKRLDSNKNSYWLFTRARTHQATEEFTLVGTWLS